MQERDMRPEGKEEKDAPIRSKNEQLAETPLVGLREEGEFYPSEIKFTDEEIMPLAYKIWEDKGKPFQEREEDRGADWVRAIGSLKEERLLHEERQRQEEERKNRLFSDEEVSPVAYEIWQRKGEPFQENEEDRNADWFVAVDRLRQSPQEEQPQEDLTENNDNGEVEIQSSDREISVMAYRIWEEKGRPFQSEEEMKADWSKAIDMLKQEKNAQREMAYEIPQVNFQQESIGSEVLETSEDYEPTDDEIRPVAYEIWERKTHGHDMEDWLEAIAKLKQGNKLSQVEESTDESNLSKEHVILEQKQSEYEPTFNEISEVARQIWERKGMPEGQDDQNWKEAIILLKSQYRGQV